MSDIKLLLEKVLLPLSAADFRTFQEILDKPVNYGKQPNILDGDFDANFLLPEPILLLKFLKTKFSFNKINSWNDSTTKGSNTKASIITKVKKGGRIQNHL